jgi:hypothetical protein
VEKGTPLRFSVVGSWEGLAVSMREEKVVKTREGPNPGYLQMDGRMIEFGYGGCQMQVLDIPYGLKLAGAGKGPELAQAYLEGLDGPV